MISRAAFEELLAEFIVCQEANDELRRENERLQRLVSLNKDMMMDGGPLDRYITELEAERKTLRAVLCIRYATP